MADLQPEDSEGEEEGSGAKAELSPDQKVHEMIEVCVEMYFVFLFV